MGKESNQFFKLDILVAIYCRVSTEDQKERQTIENQIQDAKEYCQRHGYIIYAFYCDDGVSGTIPFEKREAGKRLLQDARQGKFRLMLISNVKRLGRDTKNSLIAADDLKQLGIAIKSITEPFDTSTPMGEWMFTQLASIAKLDWSGIREQTMSGTDRVARQGKWLGGIVPYGYMLNESGFLMISEEPLRNLTISEAEVVKMIYGWIGSDGLSTIEVAKRLNAMNIPAHYAKDGREFYLPPQNRRGAFPAHGKRKVRTSGLWHPHRIGNLIHNTTYMGIHHYGKRSKKPRELITRQVPAIVSPDLWEKAQETLKNNFLWAVRNTRREYLLRGLIRCGVCGRNLSGSCHKSRRREFESWYRCNGKLNHVKIATGKAACPAKSVKSEWLESLVWGELKDWILNREALEETLSAKLQEYEKEKGTWFAQVSRLKADISLKEEERSKIFELYRKGLMAMSDVEKQLKQIDSEKAELENMASELKNKMISDFSGEEAIREIKNQLDEFRSAVEKDTISWTEKRKIVETFVKQIQINLTKDKQPALLIDTIPLRKGIEQPENLTGETIYLRLSGKDAYTPDELQRNTVNIIYRFPLPNSSIVNRTDRDSLRQLT